MVERDRAKRAKRVKMDTCPGRMHLTGRKKYVFGPDLCDPNL